VKCKIWFQDLEGLNVKGTKWIYKNKSDENGISTRN